MLINTYLQNHAFSKGQFMPLYMKEQGKGTKHAVPFV